MSDRPMLATTGTLLEDDKQLRQQQAHDAREEAVEAVIEEAIQIAWAASPPGSIDALCEEQLRAVLRLAYTRWGVEQ